MTKILTPWKLSLVFLLSLSMGCGGGGGGSGSANGGAWDVRASVASDTCKERLSAVRQTFNVSITGSDVVVDSAITNLTGTTTGDGFTASFSETNGACARRYDATFSGTSSDTAAVSLKATSTCSGVTCATEWVGTATRIG